MADTGTRAKLFLRNFLITAACGLVGLLAFLVTVDAFDTLHLSPPAERGVVAHNQRFGYAALARSDRFDSAIFGTSTTRMIDPDHINDALDAKFVNLSLNSGTWWEQRELFSLFLRHHPAPKRVAIGLDVIWCEAEKTGPKLAGRLFPPWLYDDNPWNDYLHLLNFKVIEHSFDQVAYLFGVDKSRYGRDGFRSLNKKGTPYDLGKARKKIYGSTTPVPAKAPLEKREVSTDETNRWPYPNIETLRRMLARLPQETEKLLIFVPYHQHLLGAPGGRSMIRYEECKKRVAQIKPHFKNLKILDFMFRSDFTMEDANYWDTLHFNEKASLKIERYIVDYWTTGTVNPSVYKGL